MKTQFDETLPEQTTPTAIVAHNGSANTALAIPTDYVPVAGLNELSPDDFTLPTLKLTQAQSTQDGADKHLGEWFRRDTGEYYQAPNLLVLGIAKSRVMFPAEYGSDSEPICKSDDSHKPRPEFMGQTIEYKGSEGVIGATCAECPFSMWGDDGQPPACTLTENWAALTDGGDPVIVRLSRSAAKASSQLKNMSRAAALKKRPLYVNLSSRAEKGDRGRYYVPVIAPAQDAPNADLLEVAKSLVGINLAARAAETVERADAVDGSAAGKDLPF